MQGPLERTENQKLLQSDDEKQDVRDMRAGICRWIDDNLPNVMAVVILANAVEMGAQNQWRMSEYPVLKDVYLTLDVLFTVFYVAEVLIGLCKEGLDYFNDRWNILDFTITVLGLFNLALEFETRGSAGPDRMGSLAKLARLTRLARVVRIIKVLHSLRDLSVVVEGLMRSMAAISWVLLLLFIVVYVWALVICMTIDNSIYDEPVYFTDMASSILTMLDIAMMAEWGSIVRPIMAHQTYLLPLFFIFVIISAFGMLNVMIGVIVDSTVEAKQQFEEEDKRALLDKASKMWQDTIHQRQLSQADLDKCTTDEEKAEKENLRNVAIKDILQFLVDDPEGIPFPHGFTNADVLDLLDYDAGGSLTHAEFKKGVENLLLGSSFQLTCTILTMIAKLRRERAAGVQGLEVRLDDVLAQLERGKALSSPGGPDRVPLDARFQTLEDNQREFSSQVAAVSQKQGDLEKKLDLVLEKISAIILKK